jgi:arylsulfate sulfotransferase
VSDRRTVPLCASLLFVTSCAADEAAAPTALISSVANVRVAPNPYNTLSTVVTFDAVDVDSARVRYAADNEPAQYTPCYPVTSGSARVVTLGLRPNRSYSHVVETCGRDTVIMSAPITSATGDLPALLKGVRLEISGTPYSGYTVLSSSRSSSGFVLAFDGLGDIRWYREFPHPEDENAREGKQQPNGNFTVFLGATSGWQPTHGRYVEFKPDGEVVQTYAASPPYYTDNHELLLTSSDSGIERAHLFGYDLRPTDLRSIGGSSNVLLAGHTLLRQARDGSVEFRWSAWDHFTLDDWIEPPESRKRSPNTDFDHPNSLDFDLDGHYVVSWRNLGEVRKIDAMTGRMIWRFGGRNNQFTIHNDPLRGFSGQHSVRVVEGGDFLMFDNGLRHDPPESRAVQYRLDTLAMTATMVWQYRHTPPIYTDSRGSVQRLGNGHTLVGFSVRSFAVEVGVGGQVVWEGQLTFDGVRAPPFYRIWKVASLYGYEPS